MCSHAGYRSGKVPSHDQVDMRARGADVSCGDSLGISVLTASAFLVCADAEVCPYRVVRRFDYPHWIGRVYDLGSWQVPMAISVRRDPKVP